MSETQTLQPSKGLAITYLVRLGIASPSGGRSEIENLNVIKKIREGYFDYPYASSQAMKRALRDTLRGLGHSVSPIVTSKPSRTAANPIKYIDDDLFGFMDPSSKKDIKGSEGSESIEEGEEELAEEKEEMMFSKNMIEKVPKKFKGKIEKLFREKPSIENLSFKDLIEGLQLSEKEIESIKKSITKDDAVALNNMLRNLKGIRKSVISMTPLLSLSAFDDSVDFGANMMGLKGGGSPMPYETEVHRGWYRITIYIDLDRVGTGDGFIDKLVKVGEEKSSVSDVIAQKIDFDFIWRVGDNKFVLIKKEYSPLGIGERYRRAKALLDSIRFLAPSGRSSNWLIDLTPKIMVAAYVNGARTPFLETPLLDEKYKDKNVINLTNIQAVKDTFADGIENSGNIPCLVVGYREDLIEKSYLYSWNEIPGNDNNSLIGFLKKRFGIEWAENAKINKIDDGKTITLSSKNNFISLKLNDDKTKVSLEIDDGRTDEFIAKMENGKPNIYEKSSTVGINVQTMKSAFETIDGWLKQHFNIHDQNTASTGQTQTK